MRKIFLYIALFLSVAIPSSAQFVAITDTGVTDASGAVLVSGNECFTPANNQGTPIPAQYPGGTITTTPKCSVITNGTMAPIQLVSSAVTNPVNLCYIRTIVDNNTGKYVISKDSGYGCVQPTVATNMNTVQPTSPGVSLHTTGPTGPQGIQGATGVSGPTGLSGSVSAVGPVGTVQVSNGAGGLSSSPSDIADSLGVNVQVSVPLAAPSVTANGGGAGQVWLGQGAAPAIRAGAVTLYGAPSISGYGIGLPPTAPTSTNQCLVFPPGGGVASWQPCNTGVLATGNNTFSGTNNFTGTDSDSLLVDSGYADKNFYDNTGTYVGGVGYAGSASANPVHKDMIFLESSGGKDLCLNAWANDPLLTCAVTINHATNEVTFHHVIYAPNIAYAQAVTYTSGTGIGTITCADAAGCNSIRGIIAIPATSTTSAGQVIATLVWPPIGNYTGGPYHCTVTESGGPHGLGTLGTTTTGQPITSAAVLTSGTTVYANYTCQP